MSRWSVILVGGVPVTGRYSLGDWQLARALAKRRDVLYIDPPLYPRSIPRERGFGQTRRIRAIAPGLRAARPIASPGANRRWGLALGDALIGLQIQQAASTIKGRRVLITFDPKRGVLPKVQRDLLVYWRRDRLATSANTARPALVHCRDRELIEAADLVTGVSRPLVEESKLLGAQSELVPNGCDARHFSADTSVPSGFPTGRPIVGFAGGVSWRLDVDLLSYLADERPDWTLLFVGEGSQALPDRPNVIRVGAKSYSELPAWVQNFDVGIVPYSRDEFNLSAAPLKVFEYLAAGVPVVSTALPAVEAAANVITTCGNSQDFLRAIASALAHPPDPEDCRLVAFANDWSSRATRLESLIDGFLDGDKQ